MNGVNGMIYPSKGEFKILVIIPTLNEEATIFQVVKAFSNVRAFPLHVMVIDGNSTDNTVYLARKAGAKVVKQKSKGKGAAMIEAVEMAGDYDVYVFMDGDGTYLPLEIQKIVEPILSQKAEMVIGSRFKGKTERGAIPPINIIGNKFFNLIIKLAFKKDITDILSGYRAVIKNFFEEVSLRSNRFEIETEMTIKALFKGFRVIEVPITYLRREGRTKLKPVRDGLQIFKTLIVEVLKLKPGSYNLA